MTWFQILHTDGGAFFVLVIQGRVASMSSRAPLQIGAVWAKAAEAMRRNGWMIKELNSLPS